MTTEDAAYLAGLIDGEGCIGVRGRKDYWVNTSLDICMTTPSPLIWAAKITGIGKVYARGSDKRKNRRQTYHWKAGRVSDIASVLKELLPYLKVKWPQAKAFIVLSLLRLTKDRTRARVHVQAEQIIVQMLRKLKDDDITGAYEEALDLTVYLRQVMEERKSAIAATTTS